MLNKTKRYSGMFEFFHLTCRECGWNEIRQRKKHSIIQLIFFNRKIRLKRCPLCDGIVDDIRLTFH